MNEISFVVGELDDRIPTVIPYIDGCDLRSIVTGYEERQGFDPAGGYDGVVPSSFNFGDLLDYYLGAKDHSYWGKVAKIAVLGCVCGEVGCWPLYVSVNINDEILTWSRFEQPHRRERDYNDLGPFEFDLRTYEKAVSAVKQLL